MEQTQMLRLATAAQADQPGASPAAPTTYALVIEPDQGLSAIYNLIASATQSIDMTMYELTDTTVTSMLAAAAAKGIAVRVILDQNYERQATRRLITT